MEALLTPILSLLQAVIPGASSPVVSSAIQVVAALTPIVVREFQELKPMVVNIVTALRQSDDITEDQWAELDAISAQLDTNFQDAVANAKAEDAAAQAKKS